MPILVKNGRVYTSTNSGSGANTVEMTQAQYNALQSPDPDIIYFITDGTAGYPSADDISYDNTTSELTADSVQDAIDENAGEIATVKSGLSNLNNRIVQQNLTITPGTNITLGTQNKACIIDGFIYLSVKGRADAAISNAVIATISGNKNFIYPTTIPIGIGSEWDITGAGYGFLNGKSVTATIPSGKWFHLVATIPYA